MAERVYSSCSSNGWAGFSAEIAFTKGVSLFRVGADALSPKHGFESDLGMDGHEDPLLVAQYLHRVDPDDSERGDERSQYGDEDNGGSAPCVGDDVPRTDPV